MTAVAPEPVSNSRLHDQRPDFEDRNLAAVVHDVERRCRIMCRLMQVFCHDTDLSPVGNVHRDYDDRGAALTVFYEYIDQQMDTLSALRDEFDTGFYTLNMLKGKDDD